MSFRFHQAFVALCLSTLVGVSPVLVHGQQNAAPAAPSKTVEAPTPSSPYDLEIVNGFFNRKGMRHEATLANVVDALRDLYPDVNIAMAPDVRTYKVTDLKLRSAQVKEALEALRVASGNKFTWMASGGKGGVDPTTGMQLPPSDSSLYVLEVDRSLATAGPQRMVEVFNLKNYLMQLGKDQQGQPDETLNQIREIVMETLISLNPGDLSNEDVPTFRFHKGSSLLVVIGPPQGIDVARKVLSAMPGVTRPDGTASASPVEPPSDGGRESMMRRYGIGPRSPVTQTIPPPGNSPR